MSATRSVVVLCIMGALLAPQPAGRQQGGPGREPVPAARLRIDADRPFHPRYGDRPLLLIGVSDREALTLWQSDKGFDWRRYLDELAAHGLNYVRQNVQAWTGLASFRDHPAQFSAPRWAFRRTGPGRAVDGGPRFDLTRPDEGYFAERLIPFLRAAEQRGIMVELTLFDGCRSRRAFADSLYADANNVNGLGLAPGGDPHADAALAHRPLAAIQENYVARVLDVTRGFGNVLYEVANETGGARWVEHFVRFIHRRAPGALVSAGEQTSPYDPVKGGCDLVVKHRGRGGPYASDEDVAHHRQSLIQFRRGGKPVLHNEFFLFANRSTDDPEFVRRMFWADFTGGGHANFYDFTWWRGSGRTTEEGTPSQPPPPAIMDAGRFLRRFVEQGEVPFDRMAPHDELAKSTGRDGPSPFVFARPGEAYVVYLIRGGGVTLTIPSGGDGFTARWFNPRTGRWGEALPAPGEAPAFAAPDGHDWALLVKAGANPDAMGRVGMGQTDPGEGGERASRIPASVVVPGADRSRVFSMRADGVDLFVEAFRDIHYARLACSGPMRVELTAPDPIAFCRVAPTRFGIAPVIEGRRATFVVDRPLQHLLIRVNGLPDLILLVDPPEENPPAPAHTGIRSIMDFGVDNSGRTVETQKIQQAIDAVLQSPAEDTLYFPPGCYRTGRLVIGGDMRIYLQEGALIKGSTDLQDYPIFPQYPKRKLLLIHGARRFELCGRGVIDGEGAALADRYPDDNAARLIDLIEVVNCQNVVIRDVLLRNSSNWACLLTRTDDALVHNVKVLNVPHHLWMDAFDVSDSQNVRFQHCFAYSHDDCFAIMALNRYPALGRRETREILIRDCTGWSLCSGTRIGWNSNEKIDEVTFENVDFVFARLQHIALHGLKEGRRYGSIRFRNCRFERGGESQRFFHSEGPQHEPRSPFAADLLSFEQCRIEGRAPQSSEIIGDGAHGIRALHFRGTLFNGEPLAAPDDLARAMIHPRNVRELVVR